MNTTYSVLNNFILKGYLLEKLEGLHSPSTVGEQKTQVILSYPITKQENSNCYNLEAKNYK